MKYYALLSILAFAVGMCLFIMHNRDRIAVNAFNVFRFNAIWLAAFVVILCLAAGQTLLVFGDDIPIPLLMSIAILLLFAGVFVYHMHSVGFARNTALSGLVLLAVVSLISGVISVMSLSVIPELAANTLNKVVVALPFALAFLFSIVAIIDMSVKKKR